MTIHDRSDGWVTQRSRLKNRNDWIVVQLGTSALLKEAVVDTTFFKGKWKLLAS
jgi:allantoicase